MDFCYVAFIASWCVLCVSCSPITAHLDQSNQRHLDVQSDGPESNVVHSAVPIHVRITRNTNTDQTININANGTPVRIHIIPTKDQQNSSQSNNSENASTRENNSPTATTDDVEKSQKVDVNIENEPETTINITENKESETPKDDLDTTGENESISVDTQDNAASTQPSDEPLTVVEHNEPVVVPVSVVESKEPVVEPQATVISEESQVVTIKDYSAPKTVVIQEASEQDSVVTEAPKYVAVQASQPVQVVNQRYVTSNQPEVVYVKQPELTKVVYVQQSEPEVVYVQQPEPKVVYVQQSEQPKVVYVQQSEQPAYTVQQRPSTGVHSAPSTRERIALLPATNQQNAVYVQPQSDTMYIVQPDISCPSSCPATIDKVCGESVQREMEDFDNLCQLQAHNCQTTPKYEYYRKGKCPMNVIMSS